MADSTVEEVQLGPEVLEVFLAALHQAVADSIKAEEVLTKAATCLPEEASTNLDVSVASLVVLVASSSLEASMAILRVVDQASLLLEADWALHRAAAPSRGLLQAPRSEPSADL